MLIRINKKPSARELRQFAALWLPLFLGLAGAAAWRSGHSPRVAGTLWVLGAALGILGWLRPLLFRRLYVGWMMAAFPIGWTVSYLVVTVIFYFVLTPVGVIMRLLGHDPLRRGFDRSVRSYWIERRPAERPERYFQQF